MLVILVNDALLEEPNFHDMAGVGEFERGIGSDEEKESRWKLKNVWSDVGMVQAVTNHSLGPVQRRPPTSSFGPGSHLDYIRWLQPNILYIASSGVIFPSNMITFLVLLTGKKNPLNPMPRKMTIMIECHPSALGGKPERHPRATNRARRFSLSACPTQIVSAFQSLTVAGCYGKSHSSADNASKSISIES